MAVIASQFLIPLALVTPVMVRCQYQPELDIGNTSLYFRPTDSRSVHGPQLRSAHTRVHLRDSCLGVYVYVYVLQNLEAVSQGNCVADEGKFFSNSLKAPVFWSVAAALRTSTLVHIWT